MRVLWFTNTPCSYHQDHEASSASGGWMTSLEKEISKQKQVQLGICFISHKQASIKEVDNVQYYPISTDYSGTKIGRWLVRRFDLEDDDSILERAMGVINTFKPDIIHVHGTEGCFGLIKEQCNIPVVVSIQGILSELLPVFFGALSTKQLSALMPIKARLLANDLLTRGRKFEHNARREKAIFSLNKYYIGRTGYDHHMVKKYSPEASYFHGEELLRPAFYSQHSIRNFNPGEMVLCTTIGNNLYKGYDRILRIAEILKKSNIKFQWKVIGINEESEIVSITENFLGLTHNNLGIYLLDSLSADEIVEHILNATIYCHSSYMENSSNSICEAQILGLPVIAFDNGGTSSIISDRVDGLLVEDGDCESFSKQVINLAGDEDLRIALAKAAQKRAWERHERGRCVSEYIKLYKQIMDCDR